MMNLNQFTIKAQEALANAQQQATANQHPSIEVAHLFKGMMDADEHVVPFLLKKMNVSVEAVEAANDRILEHLATVEGAKYSFQEVLRKR